MGLIPHSRAWQTEGYGSLPDFIVSIDVGVAGAIAYLDMNGVLIGLDDIPVDVVSIGKNERKKLSVHRLFRLLTLFNGAAGVIERPDYRPMMKRNAQTGVPKRSTMGVSGAGAFGETYGGTMATMVCCGISLHEVRPGPWKAAMKLGAAKDDSRRMAQNMFPLFASAFDRKKDDGRAEAAIMGFWYARELRK
jgi:crossover junction endodeoxyribonuclease RuvC